MKRFFKIVLLVVSILPMFLLFVESDNGYPNIWNFIGLIYLASVVYFLIKREANKTINK